MALTIEMMTADVLADAEWTLEVLEQLERVAQAMNRPDRVAMPQTKQEAMADFRLAAETVIARSQFPQAIAEAKAALARND
jgi:hypothetical protein